MTSKKTPPAEADLPTKAPAPLDVLELKAVAGFESRKAAGTPHLRVQVGGKGKTGHTQIEIPHRHPDKGEAIFCESLGTSDSIVATFVTEQLAQLSVVNGEISENVLNTHLAMVQSLGPKDEIEMMLACQMTAIHVLTMNSATSLYRSSNTEHRERTNGQLNKLARTFTTQMEALKRYRSKGEQKVVVEHQHVHVYPGGQAVVGTVNQRVGGGGDAKNGVQSHEPNDRLRLPEGATVLSVIEADQVPMSGAGFEGEERVPIPRRESRGAVGAG